MIIRPNRHRPVIILLFLRDYNVRAELTVTQRCGFHKYTYPESDSAHVIIDLYHPGGAEELYIKKVSDTEIEGFAPFTRVGMGSVSLFCGKVLQTIYIC